jgi:membrane protease YdiL (CAAX protease family)
MLVGIVLATAIAVVLALLGATESDPVLLVASSAGLWVGLVGACVVAVRRKGTGSLRDLGLVRVRWADPLLGLGFGVAGLVSVGVVLSILNQISPDLLPGNRDDISDPLRHGGTLGVVAVALVAVVGAPFVEELFFRGLVQGTLVSRWGLAIGVTAQAVLFGLVHLSPAAGLGNVGTFVNILVVGMGLGWIRFVSRRLDPGMFAHATYNALFVLIAITR